jgi:predicted dehydrogenase
VIRVAVIGYGYVGRVFHVPLLRSVPGLELSLVGSRSIDKVHANLPDVAVVEPEAALAASGVDLVVIATPNETHHRLASLALGAGKNVVVDKPFALTTAEASDLVDHAKRRQRLLSVFHNRRWDSDFLAAREIVNNGRIGHITHFESRFDRFRPNVQDRWRERVEPGGGVWYDLGPHLVDQALQLFGSPRSVTAHVAALRPGAPTNDWAEALLDYGDRVAVLRASMLVAGGSPRLALHGTRGSWIKNRPDVQEDQLRADITPDAPGFGVDPDPALLYGPDGERTELPVPPGDYLRYYESVRDAILGRGPNPVTPEDALDVMKVLDAAMESSASRRTVALPKP